MSIRVRHITTFLDQWAPPDTQLDYDNVGLLIGDQSKNVQKILVCLDVTSQIVEEAINRDCDLIVAHHPLIFKGLKRINPSSEKGKIIYRLIREDIAVVAAHTNLDAALDGVSFALGKKLGLKQLKFLDKNYPVSRKMVLTTAGVNQEDVLKLLNYYSAEEAHVYTVEGRKGHQENYEAVIDTHNLPGLKKELKKSGLLEKGSLQVMKLSSPTNNAGMGVTGLYRDQGLEQDEFLQLVADQLNVEAVRFSGTTDYVKKVAVCGGAGVMLAGKAKASGAQALVTADVKYHDYFMNHDNFLLVDVGHYQSEAPIISVVQQELTDAFDGLEVMAAQTVTDPMQVFINNDKHER